MARQNRYYVERYELMPNGKVWVSRLTETNSLRLAREVVIKESAGTLAVLYRELQTSLNRTCVPIRTYFNGKLITRTTKKIKV